VIDYLAVLDDLAEKRAAAVNLFDQVSAGLRLLVRSPAPTAAAPPRQLRAPAKAKKPQRAAAKAQRTPAGPAASAKAKPAPKAVSTRSGKVSVSDWERARKWWTEGVKVTEIAKRIGCSDPTVYNHAAAHGWPKRPNARKAASSQPVPKAVSKPNAKGEKVPMRRCDSCQMTTERDPCHLCGTKWKRTEA